MEVICRLSSKLPSIDPDHKGQQAFFRGLARLCAVLCCTGTGTALDNMS